MQLAWLEHRDSDTIVCQECSKEAYSFKDTKQHYCAGCRTERPENQFLEKEIVTVLANAADSGLKKNAQINFGTCYKTQDRFLLKKFDQRKRNGSKIRETIQQIC